MSLPLDHALGAPPSQELRCGLFRWRPHPREDRIKSIPYQLQRLFVGLQMKGEASLSTRDLTRSFGWADGDQFVQQVRP